MKTQKEILAKMRAAEIKAPSRFDESSLGLVVSSLDPPLSKICDVLKQTKKPFKVEHNEEKDTITIGDFVVERPSPKENWVIRGRSGQFLRSFDAILQAITLCYANILYKRVF